MIAHVIKDNMLKFHHKQNTIIRLRSQSGKLLFSLFAALLCEENQKKKKKRKGAETPIFLIAVGSYMYVDLLGLH